MVICFVSNDHIDEYRLILKANPTRESARDIERERNREICDLKAVVVISNQKLAINSWNRWESIERNEKKKAHTVHERSSPANKISPKGKRACMGMH